VDELARADQRRNDPRALAAALRGLGAGAMEPLWGRLGELAMPVAAIAGERDSRYVELARRMVGLIAVAELQILPGGHVVLHESPAQLADALATGPRDGAPSRAS
jgi:pimeloyl-ACP methyl ester carboxylesterase